MTTSSTSNTGIWSYTGTGALTTFGYDNKIFVDSDLKVFVDGTLKTLTTDYTVTGAGTADGGNVVFGTAPAADTEVVLFREVDDAQESDYVDGDQFPADVVEDDFDRQAILNQDNKRDIARSLRLADFDAETTIAAIPDKAARLGKALTFDATTGAPAATAFADLPTGVSLSDAAPQNLGTAAAGVANSVSRSDHVHKQPTLGELGAEAADPDILKSDTDDVLTAGFGFTPVADGTQSGGGTYSPTYAGGAWRSITNGGNFTLTPPASGNSIIVDITNNASAGSITTSGFTKVTGAALGTTENDVFRCHINAGPGGSHLHVVHLVAN